MAMEETLGMSAISFIMSAAELQDLMTHYRLNTDHEKASERVKAVIQNPHLADWFFLHHAENFLTLTFFFENCLDVKDLWAQTEYQHGSARVQHPTDDKPIDPRDSAHADHEAQEVYNFADALV